MNDSALITPYLDKSGFVWISTFKGMDKYDPVTNVFTHYISKPGDPSTPGAGWLRYAYETPEGDIWFQGNTGMSFYNRKTNRFIRYESDEKQEDGLWGYIVSTFVDGTGMVWLGSYLSGLNKESRIIQFPLIRNIPGNPNSLQNSTVYSIYEAPSEPGIIWFGTETGLDRYDKNEGTYTHYRHEEDKGNSISKGGVSSITEDKKGRFWVATHGGGLNLMDRRTGSFIHFVHDTLNPKSLIYNNINFLKSVSDGTLWIGTYYGLDHFDCDNNKFTNYQKADTSYTPELFNLIAQYTTPDRRVAAIIHPGDNVNITTRFNLTQPADILVTGMGEITSINNDDWGWIEDASGKTVWDMNIANTLSDGFQDARLRAGIIHLDSGSYSLRYKSDSHYSYGHWNGPAPYHFGLWGLQVTKISVKENQVFNNEAAKRYVNGPGGNSISSITEDSKKNIWIGSNDIGGVTKFNPATGEFISYIDVVKGPLAVTGSVLEDKKTGNFWVGDYAFGLLLINKNGDIIKRYNASNGLSGNTIEGILQDSKGVLWVSTDNGLCRFDPVIEKFQLYNKNHGLQGLAFNSMAICRTANGEMYFGGANGVNAFFPDQIKLDTMAFPVVLTDLDIGGKPAMIGKNGQTPVHISLAKEIVLPYDQNDLTFHFTSLLFNRGNESQFAFRLTPNDKDWVQSGTIRQARYTSLSPGSYTFSVKAANADGFWNEQGVSITIHILPPWWRTWWAYTLYALALISGIFGFMAYRSAALKRENKILEEKVELRTNQLQTSIEKLKATQSQLIQSEKMASLGELTAGIAHEIQNPLNFVNNFSEVNKDLIEELKEEAKSGNNNEVIAIANDISINEEKINYHGKRADAIVKGMLQHSRTSAGVKESTDINVLVDEYLRLAFHGLRAKDKNFNAEMKTDFDNTIRKINIIPQDIGRVLLNLYNNAFYAISEKKKSAGAGYEPTISVNTRTADKKVTISVKDNGNGIPQEIVDKIFQPFFTTKPTGQGTGLGLSLSYDIVKAHGGEIKVVTKEGEYTEFNINLPI
jgi:signal transduction histidine kinase/ligand-binding sensor domain-containing protein